MVETRRVLKNRHGGRSACAAIGIRSAVALPDRVHPRVHNTSDAPLVVVGFVEDRVLLDPVMACAGTRAADGAAATGKSEEELERAGQGGLVPVLLLASPGVERVLQDIAQVVGSLG